MNKLFLMLEEFYSCTDILHTKKETLFVYNFRNQFFFYWYSLCNTERNVMEMGKWISAYCQMCNKFEFSQETEMQATSMATTHC